MYKFEERYSYKIYDIYYYHADLKIFRTIFLILTCFLNFKTIKYFIEDNITFPYIRPLKCKFKGHEYIQNGKLNNKEYYCTECLKIINDNDYIKYTRYKKLKYLKIKK